MNNRNNGSPVHRLNSNRWNQGTPNYRTVKKLSRLSSAVNALEPLEQRTMMSAAPLATPSAVNVIPLSTTSVEVTWADSGTTQSGYKVLRATGSGGYAQLAEVVGPTTLSYLDATVVPHTSYKYKVEAYAAKVTSAGSAAAPVKTPLITPIGLSANVSSSQIVLTWTDKDTTATGYNILRSINGGAFYTLTTLTSGSAATYTDSSVLHGTSYRYEVQAKTSTNTSAVSGIATGVTALAAPSGLTATAEASNFITLNWTDNDSGATGYIVLRSTTGATYTAISTLTSGSAASFDDKTVAPFTTYYYKVEAKTAAVTSAVSSSATAKTPLAAPTGLVSAIGQNSIIFNWADTDLNAKGFIVLQAVGSGSFSQVATITSGKTWTDTSYTTDAAYSFEIEATNGTAVSAASTALTMTTPLSVPTGVTANASSGTSMQVSWTDTDNNATSYTILRAVNGGALVTLTTVTGGTTASYTDNGVSPGHDYAYDVMANAGTNHSGMSNINSAVTPITAPSALQANSTTGTSVVLSWTGQDSSATGYTILRSTNNTTFTKIASVSGVAAHSYTDSTVGTAQTYYYQVQALNSYTTSAVSSTATVTTPLLAPTGLVATAVGTNINLTWADKDTSATGFVLLRSTDGTNFSQLAQLTSNTVLNYADATATPGQKYYYQVQATATGFTSAVSNTVSYTIAVPTPSPSTTTVTITTRNTNELVINANGSSDSISVNQSGNTLTITTDGQTTTDPVPAAGLFIYTRAGSDSINILSGVSAQTIVETINTGVADITSAGTNVTVWDNSSDIFTGTGTVNTVKAFAGGVAMTTGASLANPKDSGTTSKLTGSLFGTAPVAADINQGQVGDCYFLSSLAAIAGEQPAVLEQSAVDMGDGTYVVKFMSGSTPTYVRVNNSVPTSSGYLLYARPGTDGDIWAPIFEKAYADFRTGANSYASLNSGWMGDVYAAFGIANSAFFPSQMTSSAFFTMVSNDLANGKEVTLGTGNSTPQLVSDHAYTLVSATMVNGVASYVVRNPWGVQGDSLENSQGYATLTFAQLEANFVDGCQAT